jgi:NADPH:quinone reductase-like Zn-dependent oxidoreductase
MLAAYAARTGGDDPLANVEVGERPLPEPRPGWVLVRVAAASLNHHDLWTLRGVSSGPVETPQILGCDAAGTVERYGGEPPAGAPAPGSRVVVHAVIPCGGCAGCAEGDPVSCRRPGVLSESPLPGTLAEFVAVPAANLVPLPDAVGFAEAACLPTAYLTAYHMLFTSARLRPGDAVLVQGGSGGLATAAILLARAAGIRVLATSRSEDKRALCRELGAEDAYPVERETARRVQAATGGRGADAVIESVGEPTWELSLRSVRPGGIVVVAGATGGPNPPAQLHRIFWYRITIAGTSMGSIGELRRMVTMCATATLRPLIGARHRLADAPVALRAMAAGDTRGKIVIDVGGARSD